jgi:hypothetical protein
MREIRTSGSTRDGESRIIPLLSVLLYRPIPLLRAFGRR